MCPALPYAVAAKFAYPGRPVIAVEGDGSMQMNGINALIDAARYYERWSDPRLAVLVLHNNDLNQVTWEQRVLAGDAKLDASQSLPDFPYADYARLIGLDGVRVDAPDQIAPAWEQAMHADRPFVLEAITDPNVPPLPPHIGMDQAKKMGMALIGGGEEDAGAIMKQAIKGKWQELVKR
jgi:pyruvate dehydrogenase (quinone)